MNTVPTLHTDRCTLSAVTQSDIPVLREILDDSETQRFLPKLCEEFQTAGSLQQFITSFDQYLLQGDGVLWGIRKDDTLIGFIAIMDIMTNPTLFYAMHPDYRNRGYMKECVAVIMQHIRASKMCVGVNTEVCKENVVSQQLLISMGFKASYMGQNKVYYRRIL